jgi:hypothetical protein
VATCPPVLAAVSTSRHRGCLSTGPPGCLSWPLCPLAVVLATCPPGRRCHGVLLAAVVIMVVVVMLVALGDMAVVLVAMALGGDMAVMLVAMDMVVT